MKLAVIIPSIKPYDISCRLAVDSIIKSIQRSNIDCDYTIYVHSPNNPNDERIVFVKEEKQGGENIAINNIITKISDKYDYYFLTADDFVLTDDSNLLDAINFINSEAYASRKMKICTLATTQDSPCYSIAQLPFPEGSPYGRTYQGDGFLIPNFIICRFPVFDKKTLNVYLNNHIFPPNVYSGYGDSCLSYYLTLNDEPCLEVSSVKLHFLEHIHDIDRISRRSSEWIRLRSESCIKAYEYIKNYIKGNKYV